ncbi:6762_t:CDS:2, partial [Racocetra persica]
LKKVVLELEIKSIESIEVQSSNIVEYNEDLELYNVHNIEIESKNNSEPIEK